MRQWSPIWLPGVKDRENLTVYTVKLLNNDTGAALLSILGVVYPMRSVAEMARLIEENDKG